MNNVVGEAEEPWEKISGDEAYARRKTVETSAISNAIKTSTVANTFSPALDSASLLKSQSYKIGENYGVLTSQCIGIVKRFKLCGGAY